MAERNERAGSRRPFYVHETVGWERVVEDFEAEFRREEGKGVKCF